MGSDNEIFELRRNKVSMNSNEKRHKHAMKLIDDELEKGRGLDK